MYRRATDFCVLILYPDTLLKMFMRSKNFLVELLGSFRCEIISSENRNNLMSSFLFEFLLFLSSVLLLWLETLVL
jgi:hypothetical protein